MGVEGENRRDSFDLGTTTAKFVAGLACLAVLQQCQQQQQQQQASQPLGMGRWRKGFVGVGGEG